MLRRGNNPGATNPPYTVSRTVYTCTSVAGCAALVAFNTTNVSQAALGAARHLQAASAIENLLSVALRDLRAAREALAQPSTLPASFRD